MKEKELMIIAGAAALIFLVTRKEWKSDWSAPQRVQVEAGNGWQYFTDGTAISPNGVYYKNGQLTWNPHMYE